MGKILVRVDGNEILATGHVMRCLSIAEALRKLGEEVVFVVADDRPGQLITGKGFQMDVLNTAWNDLNQETEILCNYVQENKVNILLLDSYYVTKEYLQILSQYTKIIYIETFANRNKKTATGRLIYPIADLFIVQWETQKKYYKKVI